MLGEEAAFQAAERWIDEWNARVQARAGASIALARGIGDVEGGARVGSVAATVDANGALVRLYLDDDLRSETPKRAAAQVLAAIDDACTVAVHEASALAARTVGPDSETGQALLAGLAANAGSSSDAAGPSFDVAVDDDVAEVRMRPSGRIVQLQFKDGFFAQPANETAEALVSLTQRIRAGSYSAPQD